MNKETLKNWKESKLDQLIDFYIGGDWGEEFQISPDYVETRVIRATDISNWEKTNGKNAQIRYLKTSSLEKRELQEGDIVIEISGGSPDQPVGRSIVVKKDKQDNKVYACSNFFRLLRVNKNEILPEFLNYYFKFLYNTRIIEQYQSNSTNLRNLKFKQFIAQKIPYPSEISKQREIVQVLDTMRDIIRLREECISHAQDLISALFYEIFGDPLAQISTLKIGQYFNVGTGATPSRENENYYIGTNPWVKTTEVNNCYIERTEEHISDEAISKTNCSMYEPGTILMAMYGQGKTRGKVAYLNIYASTNQACAALQLKKEFLNDINNKFVFYYLQIIYGYLRTLSQGGGRPNMNLSIVKNIPLFKPDIELQNNFINKVNEIESYIKEQQDELENAKQMFQSILHHAFTGELTKHKYGE